METIKASQPTYFPGVPTMYVAVPNFPNAQDYGLSSIKYCNSGAAPLPLEVAAFEERFGGKIRERYGLSQTSPFSHGQSFFTRPRPSRGARWTARASLSGIAAARCSRRGAWHDP